MRLLWLNDGIISTRESLGAKKRSVRWRLRARILRVFYVPHRVPFDHLFMQTSTPIMATCACCRARVLDGFESCRAMFNAVLEREYSIPAFGEAHLFTVDAFCLQHSEQCGPRSNAFHLMRLCWLMEHGGDPDIRQARRGGRAFRKARELELRSFPFLEPPGFRGELTVVSVLRAKDPKEHVERARAWGQSVWSAWSRRHPWAREQAAQWFLQSRVNDV
jgi:Family of unknown function (DUF5946)